MALHEQCVGATDEWYTPSYIFDALDTLFDLDVASPGADVVPWVPAHRCFTKAQDGLASPWEGLVWMNPPFGGRNGLVPWLDRFIAHGRGICLVPDRTSAPWWQAAAPKMSAVLFVAPKIKFIGADGQPGRSPAQGTCLMAIGDQASLILAGASPRVGHVMIPAMRCK